MMGAAAIGSDGSALFWPMVLLLVLLGGLAMIARRWRRPPLPGADQARIDIVAGRRLGLQSSLLLVQVDGQRFLLASTRSGIVPLAPLAAADSASNGADARSR